MIFNESKPIYIQIAELICDKIVGDVWCADDRIPSVRELGGELEVNPNTVMRAYEWLSQQGVVYNRRGVGFFVAAEARETIVEMQRRELFDKDLRQLAQRMQLLGISTQQVVEQLERHINKI
ncbi:MAG: GntR family transcriptional regulator [Rikenellaceae bacterium]